MARPKTSEADFVGPLQLLVVGTLGYLLWLAVAKSTVAKLKAQTGEGS